MNYYEAKRKKEELDRKFYETSEPMAMGDAVFRGRVVNHECNHFGELLAALHDCLELLKSEYPEDQWEKYYTCIPAGIEALERAENVEGI